MPAEANWAETAETRQNVRFFAWLNQRTLPIRNICDLVL